MLSKQLLSSCNCLFVVTVLKLIKLSYCCYQCQQFHCNDVSLFFVFPTTLTEAHTSPPCIKWLLVLQQTQCIYNIRSPLILTKYHTPYLPQSEVQVHGVVAGWGDINHCVAAQRPIRAIHVQPYPIMRILCETWELDQIVELVARPDVGNLFRPFEMSVVQC